jgi:carboxylate-amine ligase
MSIKEPPFTIGLEEEYLLVDRETRELAVNPPESILTECAKRVGGQVTPEFLRSQIEVATSVCKSVTEARAELAELRRTVSETASEYGLAPIAASTHPFSSWTDQRNTLKERYIDLARDLQDVARRMVICGMHTHVGIDDDDLRTDLVNQLGYFLPHFLALSCSSPFWQGHNTGLMSYRQTIINDLPRTGMPERFASFAEYRRHVDTLISAGIIEDATKIWWDVRPSDRYPTVEVRITDVCTRLDDAVSIAALIISTLRMLYRLRRDNQNWRHYPNMLISENRWRAMRYSYDEGLIDFGKSEIVPTADLVEELIELVSGDAEELGCREELLASRKILEHGTSAHQQIEVYNSQRADGSSHEDAMNAVVDMLIEQTAKV